MDIMDDRITIEVDGRQLKARRGQMLIEVTDQAGVYVPRFCYHEKLSVAANCRMCMVEVEKAPKPVPACATPVLDGMKVFTNSVVAREAQKATMEFLLINHPLDCPICDQGGECELQDLAMGYGSDVSRYSESKRVVMDHDIGPLVQTELTRCIHCTRCIRFGEEIAGMRELGATGRSEDMTIGTYVEQAMTSELSGNVIDICPVGALTSKPYRYSARAWELRQTDAIAPHDSVGSNIHLHFRGKTVKRVVPKHNEAVNEQWISDRDRFSYQGLYAEDRLDEPMIKVDGQWQVCEWQTALEAACSGLRQVVSEQGADALGALASPSATLEELYLLQKLVRALGSNNIDHRLRQQDCSDDDRLPAAPTLGCTLPQLEELDHALIIGGWPRQQQPLLNHRLHVVADHGTRIMAINPMAYEYNYQVVEQIVAPESDIARQILGVCRVLVDSGISSDEDLTILQGIQTSEQQHLIARELLAGKRGHLLIGNTTMHSIHGASIRAATSLLSRLTGCPAGVMPSSANSVGGWLAGAVPHRLPGGVAAEQPGMIAAQMLNHKLPAYVLLNIEPELDCIDSRGAREALEAAQCVVSLTAYASDNHRQYADVMLPIAAFVATAGTYVNCEGRWQSFTGSVAPYGNSRPAWKILRVLGNHLGLAGFGQDSAEQVREELAALCPQESNPGLGVLPLPELDEPQANDLLELFIDTPMYSIDPLVRRGSALQQTPHVCDGKLHLGPQQAAALGLEIGTMVEIEQGGSRYQLPLCIDERLPMGVAMLHGGQVNQLRPNLGIRVLN